MEERVANVIARNLDMFRDEAIPNTLHLQVVELCESVSNKAREEGKRE